MKNLGRFIPNPYLNSFNEVNEKEVLATVKEKLNELISHQMKSFPPDSNHKIYSDGRKKTDYSLYSGTGGNMYTYWRYMKFDKKSGLEYFTQAFEVNSAIVNHLESDKHFNLYDQSTSFFHGPVGVFTMGCLLCKETNDEEKYMEILNNVLKYKEVVESNSSEDELLYGNAGYLYSLLLIYQNCQIDKIKLILETAIVEVTKLLYKIGDQQRKKHKTEFLIYPFPRIAEMGGSSKVYLGGAHGIFGVLFEMLSALNLLGEGKFDFDLKSLIKDNLISLASLQFKSGNFPSSLNSHSDSLVQFCHGATGAIFLYSTAYDVFKEQLFLEVAVSCGNALWERGILTKGNGICHGITGNAYGLFKLYKLTKEEEWKKKFLCMLKASYEESIQNVCNNFSVEGRLERGVADTPYSLMEGQGGTICLYAEILSGEENEMLFPGYEV